MSVQASSFNFGAASRRDGCLFGSAGPGYSHPRLDTPRTPRGPPIQTSTISDWLQFLKDAGITSILSLLTYEELAFFANDYKEACSKSFKFFHVPLTSPGAMGQILDIISESEASGNTIVVHCASGQKRTGDVMALWLHHRYKLSVESAVEEVLQNAKESGTIRRPSVDGVLKVLAPDSKHRLSARQLAGLPKRANPAWAGNPSLGGGPNTSRLSNLHLTLVQMGGAIDKDFSLHPEGTVSDPASVKILDSMLCGFTYDFVSVSQSLRVLQKHREELLLVVQKARAHKVVITHPLEGLVETAQMLRSRLGAALDTKTVVLTGAVWAYDLKRSDAGFNLGVALGAINVLRRGIYVCMNGRVFEASRCQRDKSTGIFYGVQRPSASSSAGSGGGGGGGGGGAIVSTTGQRHAV